MISETILQFLKKLKLRPGMYFVGEKTYKNFEIYLSGYLMGLGVCLDKNLMHEINIWYFKKHKIKASSILWVDHIKLLGNENDDQYIIDKLFDELISYFQGNNL